jgi:hypothetical protein
MRDGVAATAERLAGEPLSYKEEVRRCYGIEVEWVDVELSRAVRAAVRRLAPAGFRRLLTEQLTPSDLELSSS